MFLLSVLLLLFFSSSCFVCSSCANHTSLALTTENDFKIVCSGTFACWNTSLITTNSIQNIYCTATLSCFKSKIDSNFGDVYCTGERSCGTATITNARNVYCTAGSSGKGHSCTNSTIKAAQNVYFLGGMFYGPGDSSNNTKIISKGNSMSNYDNNYTMNVYFGAYLAAVKTSVYCIGNDICNIYCVVNGACDDTTEIYCLNRESLSNCIVHCDFNDSDACPNVYRTSKFPTTIPSNSPSNLPTIAPTNNPSLIPSRQPSFNPSSIPTNYPSVPPTGVPSQPPTIPPTNSPSVPPTPSPTSINDALIESFNNTALYLVFIFIILSLLIMSAGLIFHKIMKKGSDFYSSFSILRFFQSIGDFSTDVIFAATLYVNRNEELAIASTIFVVIP